MREGSPDPSQGLPLGPKERLATAQRKILDQILAAIPPQPLLWFIERVAAAEGFAVHAGKTRIMHHHQRQQLAGLVVNRSVRAGRAEFDALKALLHHAIRDGAEPQNRDRHPDFRAHVYGRIEWLSTGSSQRGERLRAMAAQVDWDR